MALEKMWSQKRGLPVDVPLISEIEVNKMNKIILATPPRIKAKRVDTQSPSPRPSSSPSPRKRGTYNKVLPPQKFLMCQHAVKYGVIPTIRDRKYVGWRVAAGSLRGWLVLYRKAKTVLGRAPKDALESGLVPTKRGPKTMFGEENKTKLVSYLKNLRKSGSDVNRYTTGCAAMVGYGLNEEAIDSMIENRYKEFNKDKSIDEDWVRFVDEDEEKEERIIGRKQKQKQKRGRKRKRKTHDGYEVRPNQKEIGFYRERLSRKKLLLDKVVKKLPDMEKRENKTVSKKKDKNKKRKAKTKAKRKTKPKGNTNTN
eukprot:186200_1